ncbi:MAG: hypothetical protein IPJ21_02650 [Sterolibacteriaceae bacterium]|nr:hypothetical protein [Sterolibacteriaceae bacterium]
MVRLAEPLCAGAHLNGSAAGSRLGGGGANAALALAAAGHQVTLLAAIGEDAEGATSLAELASAGVCTAGIVRLARPTTRSLILLDPAGERTVVNVTRCEEPAPPYRLLDLPAEAVYVRSRRADLAALLAAKAATSLVVAHMPPVEPASRPAHVLVASASDLPASAASDPLALGRTVAGTLLRWVVITDGAAGARAVSETGALNALAARVEPLDTTGAGDAFAAGLVHALVSGQSMAAALDTGVRFGTEATLWARSGLPAEAVQRLLAR